MKTSNNTEPKWWRGVNWPITILRTIIASPIMLGIMIFYLIVDFCFGIVCTFGWACQADFAREWPDLINRQIYWLLTTFGPTYKRRS